MTRIGHQHVHILTRDPECAVMQRSARHSCCWSAAKLLCVTGWTPRGEETGKDFNNVPGIAYSPCDGSCWSCIGFFTPRPNVCKQLAGLGGGQSNCFRYRPVSGVFPHIEALFTVRQGKVACFTLRLWHRKTCRPLFCLSGQVLTRLFLPLFTISKLHGNEWPERMKMTLIWISYRSPGLTEVVICLGWSADHRIIWARI